MLYVVEASVQPSYFRHIRKFNCYNKMLFSNAKDLIALMRFRNMKRHWIDIWPVYYSLRIICITCNCYFDENYAFIKIWVHIYEVILKRLLSKKCIKMIARIHFLKYNSIICCIRCIEETNLCDWHGLSINHSSAFSCFEMLFIATY